MSSYVLPPRPDRVTGEPRPPAAPLRSRTPATDKAARPNAEAGTPPPGQSPVLEWYQSSRKSALWAVVALFAVGFGYLTLRAGGFSWMSTWWLWVMPVVIALGLYPLVRIDFVSAGADWVYSRSGWVSIYELTEIKMIFESLSVLALALKDRHGRRFQCQVPTMQANPKVWDLVYNGMLHSAARGRVQSNKRARDHLPLLRGLH